MIPAELYQPIYLIVVLLLILLYYRKIKTTTEMGIIDSRLNYTQLLVCIFFIVFIGTRPINGLVFNDMPAYYGAYMRYNNEVYRFDWNACNLIWDNLESYFVSIRLEPTYWYVLVSTIYFGCMYWACIKIFRDKGYLAFLVCLAALITFSFGTNGLKNGTALSIFLLAIAYRDKWWLSFYFALISWGFHHAMQIPIASYFAFYFIKKKEIYLAIWVISFVLAAMHITYFQEMFAGFTDERGQNYLKQKYEMDVSGFRPDFIIYSAVPIFLVYFIQKKYQLESKMLDFLWCFYTLTNSVFLLCTYGSYINRIAALSWFVYPILIIYPCFLIEDREIGTKWLRYIVIGHIAFTLFMHFIYYKGLSYVWNLDTNIDIV
mgnify:CR=1 FL=1